MLALLFTQLVGQHAMMTTFQKFGDECIMTDTDVVVRKIIAVYECHDEDQYRTEFVVYWLVFAYMCQRNTTLVLLRTHLDRCHSASRQEIGIEVAECSLVR